MESALPDPYPLAIGRRIHERPPWSPGLIHPFFVLPKMIPSLLERLEEAGGGSVTCSSSGRGGDVAAGIPWPARVARRGASGASASGRLRSGFEWIAERSDDGVLVAPRLQRGDGTIRRAAAGGTPVTGERIVWVGDLMVSSPGARLRPPREPAIEFDRDGQGVTLRWTLDSPEANPSSPMRALVYHLRVTVPCRPAGETTFENDALDPDVWPVRTRRGSQALRMRPYPSLPEIEFAVEGSDLQLEPAPEWVLGVDVCDPTGRPMGEDRFSPGTFVVTRPPGQRDLALRIRVAPGRGRRRRGWRSPLDHDPSSGDAPLQLAPGEFMIGGREHKATPEAVRLGALLFPGQWSSGCGIARERALRALLLDAAPFISGDRLDVALWAARAAYLVPPSPADDVTSVTYAFLRRIVQRIDVAWKSTGCPGAAGAGLPRFFGSEGATVASGAIPIEHAALLYQATTKAAELAAVKGDTGMESLARGHAIRLWRWFQRAYWLGGPGRPRDLAWEFESPDRTDQLGALALRPHMLLAASFPGAPLTRWQRGQIVRAVESRLLMEGRGLCTLDPEEPAHDSTSLADGAAWPWLLGPFVEATLLAFGSDRARRRALGSVLDGAVLKEAPMAWASSRASVPGDMASGSPWGAPLGPLFYALNQAEEARARALLSRCPIEVAS